MSRSHLFCGCSDQAIAAVSHVLEPPKAVDNHGAIAAPPARVYASLILDTFEILGTSEVRPHHLINSHNTHTHTHT
jgi:predicted carbohydrate-binding protein with CBM5 and CBM33 domain